MYDEKPNCWSGTFSYIKITVLEKLLKKYLNIFERTGEQLIGKDTSIMASSDNFLFLQITIKP